MQGWALKQRTGSSSRKAVLLALADHANGHTGKCNPHVETLAYELELSFRTVQRALTDLEEGGFISRRRSRKADGSWGAYDYSFPPDTVSGSPPDIHDASHRTLTTQPPDTVSGQEEPEVKQPEVEPEGPAGAELVSATKNLTPSQEIVAAYVDAVAATGTPAPRRVVGMVARGVGELISEGVDPDVVHRAVCLMIERRLHPATLPTLIYEAAAGPPKPRARSDTMRYGRGMTTQQILDATKGKG